MKLLHHQINIYSNDLYNRTGENISRRREFVKHTLEKPFGWLRLLFFLPIWCILRLSYTGREGMTNQGSYYFADHIYRRNSKGYGQIGKGLDYIIINYFPSARGFRNRYLETVTALVNECRNREASGQTEIDILSCPCGHVAGCLSGLV